MTEASISTFLVVYYTPSWAIHSSRVIRAADYWEACGVAWDQVPLGADDFQIMEWALVKYIERKMPVGAH